MADIFVKVDAKLKYSASIDFVEFYGRLQIALPCYSVEIPRKMFYNALNSQNNGIQYSSSPFDWPSMCYQSYLENGTKYLKHSKLLPENEQTILAECAGEVSDNICGKAAIDIHQFHV